MKKFLQATLLLIITATVITSCSNKNIKEAKFIPKDASFVLVGQPGSLNEKLEKANIKLDTLYKQLAGKDSMSAQKFEEIKNCGIDWLGNAFMFITMKPASDKGQSTFINGLLNIKDSAKLIAFLKKQHEVKSFEVKTDKDKIYSYALLGGNHMLSWTDKYAIITVMTHTQPINKNGVDTVRNVQYIQPVSESDDLLKEVNTYYTQKESESLASVKIFTDMFKEKADGYLFSSTNSSLNLLSNMPLQLPKLEELLKDNFSTATFNFADGEIVAKSNFYPNIALGALLKKYAGPTVNLSMVENYPSQNIDGLMLASFNPDIFNGILKELEVQSMADAFLDKMGFSTGDIFKCLKGDIAVAVSDIAIGGTTDSITNNHNTPKVKMLFNATIGDKVSLDKVMSKGVESGFITKQGNVYKGGDFLKMLGLFIQIDDKNLIVASDSLTYVQYMAKTTKANISTDVTGLLKGKSTAFYMDLNNIFNSIKTIDKDSTLNTLSNTFKDIVSTTDNYDGNKVSGEFKIRMKDDKQNSLVTLMKLMPQFAGAARKTGMVSDDVTSLSFLKFLYAPRLY